MSRLVPRLATAVILGAGSAPAALAQARMELGAQGVTLLRESPYYGAGLLAAYRPGGRVRLAAAGTLGGAGHGAAGRVEFTGQFLTAPAGVTGAGLYGFGGAGWEGGQRDRGFIVVGLGLEGRPGGRSGWHLEAGIGSGFRIAAGWRIRWPARAVS